MCVDGGERLPLDTVAVAAQTRLTDSANAKDVELRLWGCPSTSDEVFAGCSRMQERAVPAVLTPRVRDIPAPLLVSVVFCNDGIVRDQGYNCNLVLQLS